MTVKQIPAGERDRRITLKNLTASATADSFGAPTTPTEQLDKVWAKIETTPGKKLQVGDKVAAESTHLVTFNYRAGVTKDTQIWYGSRQFEINALINRDEANVEYMALCREAV